MPRKPQAEAFVGRLDDVAAAVPSGMLAAARRRLPALRRWLAAHPQALEDVERSLRGARAR